jgi:Tfp pilus assembly protein PilE
MTDDNNRGKPSRAAWGHPPSPIPHPSPRRKAQLGFGLGLGGGFFDMIVVPAIVIAILVLVAIPAYTEFKARSSVNDELATVVPAAKAAVERTFASRGPTDMSRRATTGWIRPASRQNVQSMAIEKDGTITLRFTDAVAPQAENQVQIVPVYGGKALDLSQPTNKGLKFEWQCGGPAGKTTLPEKFRPKDCRGPAPN